MPSAGQWTWSDALDRIIRDEANAAGVPLDLAYTFIAVESSFDPDTYVNNALEESVGLLELNRRGGQGAGFSVAELKDPHRNLQIGLPYIRRAFEQSWAAGIAPRTFIYLVATRSGHPGQVAEDDYRINNIKNAWMIFYPAVGASLQGPGPSTSPSPQPTNASSAGMAADAALIFLLPLVIPEMLLATLGNVVPFNPLQSFTSTVRLSSSSSLLAGSPVRTALAPPQALTQAASFIARGRGARRQQRSVL